MASLVFSQLAETLDALRLSYANQNKFLINKEILPLKSRENHAGEQQLCNIFLSDKAAVTLLKEFRKHQTTSFSHAPNSNSPPPPALYLHRVRCLSITLFLAMRSQATFCIVTIPALASAKIVGGLQRAIAPVFTPFKV